MREVMGLHRKVEQGSIAKDVKFCDASAKTSERLKNSFPPDWEGRKILILN